MAISTFINRGKVVSSVITFENNLKVILEITYFPVLFLVSICYQVWRLCNFTLNLNLSYFSGNINLVGFPYCKLKSLGSDKCFCTLGAGSISKSECTSKCKKSDGTAECGSSTPDTPDEWSPHLPPAIDISQPLT